MSALDEQRIATLTRERDSARDVAVRLEQENAHLEDTLRTLGWLEIST
jgi:hypothetical protein